MARILAVADGCDAMMSTRRYRAAMPTEEIDRILQQGAGTQWDGTVVSHLMMLREQIYQICQRGLGESIYWAAGQMLGDLSMDAHESPASRTLLR